MDEFNFCEWVSQMQSLMQSIAPQHATHEPHANDHGEIFALVAVALLFIGFFAHSTRSAPSAGKNDNIMRRYFRED